MDKLKFLLEEINKTFLERGFKKKGCNFYIKESDNWGLVSFQKSKHSDQDNLVFTIEIGVCSVKLLDFLEPRVHLLGKPSIENCHWRKRIGFLMHEPKDHWWEVNEFTNLELLYKEIAQLLIEKAIPCLLESISDLSLEKKWLSGVANGITEFERLIYLTTLLKIEGKPNLKEAAMALKLYSVDKPFEDVAESHLRRLGVKW